MPVVTVNVWGNDEISRAFCCQIASKMENLILSNIWPRLCTVLASLYSFPNRLISGRNLWLAPECISLHTMIEFAHDTSSAWQIALPPHAVTKQSDYNKSHTSTSSVALRQKQSSSVFLLSCATGCKLSIAKLFSTPLPQKSQQQYCSTPVTPLHKETLSLVLSGRPPKTCHLAKANDMQLLSLVNIERKVEHFPSRAVCGCAKGPRFVA